MAVLNNTNTILLALKGEKGDKGDGLNIKKSYSSLSEMNADYSSPATSIGDYVTCTENEIIKLYVKTTSTFEYVGRLSGEDGDGKNGKSAYEIAVEEGFEGTESEWLASLKGDKGDTGITGSGVYGFQVQDGDLILVTEDTSGDTPNYVINESGEMTITIN